MTFEYTFKFKDAIPSRDIFMELLRKKTGMLDLTWGSHPRSIEHDAFPDLKFFLSFHTETLTVRIMTLNGMIWYLLDAAIHVLQDLGGKEIDPHPNYRYTELADKAWEEVRNEYVEYSLVPNFKWPDEENQ